MQNKSFKKLREEMLIEIAKSAEIVARLVVNKNEPPFAVYVNTSFKNGSVKFTITKDKETK